MQFTRRQALGRGSPSARVAEQQRAQALDSFLQSAHVAERLLCVRCYSRHWRNSSAMSKSLLRSYRSSHRDTAEMNPTRTMRLWVQSLALLSGLRIQRCCGCGV